MGAVYRALDTRLGRTVALKTVLTTPRGTAAFNQELRQRFMREALAASKVEHRNVVQVIDFGVAEDGTPYLVMEYLRGTDLAGLLKDTPNLLPIEQVADIMLTVCAALRACHQAGIVHRDLKPSNIFLAETDTGPAVKVLDFGVSKAPIARRSDAGGADSGHAPVPVARAGERQSRARERPVRAGRSAVRLPDEPAAVRGAPEPELAARDRSRSVPEPARLSTGAAGGAGGGRAAGDARRRQAAVRIGARAGAGAVVVRQHARADRVEELLFPRDAAGLCASGDGAGRAAAEHAEDRDPADPCRDARPDHAAAPADDGVDPAGQIDAAARRRRTTSCRTARSLSSRAGIAGVPR